VKQDKLFTGSKFFGLKIWIDSTGRKDVDEAMLQVFHDNYHRTAPLGMNRPVVQLVLAWSRGELPDQQTSQTGVADDPRIPEKD